MLSKGGIVYKIHTHRMTRYSVLKYMDEEGVKRNGCLEFLLRSNIDLSIDAGSNFKYITRTYTSLTNKTNTYISNLHGYPSSNLFVNHHNESRERWYHNKFSKYQYSNDDIEEYAIETLQIIPIGFINQELESFHYVCKDSIFSDYPQGFILRRWLYILEVFRPFEDDERVLNEKLSFYTRRSMTSHVYNRHKSIIIPMVKRLEEYVIHNHEYTLVVQDTSTNRFPWSVRTLEYSKEDLCVINSPENHYLGFYRDFCNNGLTYKHNRTHALEYFKRRTRLPYDILNVFIDIPPGFIFMIYANECEADNMINGSVEAYIISEWMKHIEDFLEKLRNNVYIRDEFVCWLVFTHRYKMKRFQVALNKLI